MHPHGAQGLHSLSHTSCLTLLFRQAVPEFYALYACVCAKSHQSHLTLCNLMDCSLPGSSVHGILQARTLEGIAVPSSRGPSQPRDQTCISCISCIGRRLLYHQRHLGSPLCLSNKPVIQQVQFRSTGNNLDWQLSSERVGGGAGWCELILSPVGSIRNELNHRTLSRY